MKPNEIFVGMEVSCGAHKGRLRVKDFIEDLPGYVQVVSIEQPQLVFTRPIRNLQGRNYNWDQHHESKKTRTARRKKAKKSESS